MTTIRHEVVGSNYTALLKAGLDKMMSRAIAVKTADGFIGSVAVSDLGVHLEVRDLITFRRTRKVFRFI